jgi:oligopeptide/dipeptide ABC transporter ATP-binding protein
MTATHSRRADGVLLEVRDLTIRFETPGRKVHAVDDISFGVSRGEVVALVGESGSGKSATALGIMGLLPKRYARSSGSVTLAGRQLTTMTAKEMRGVRGRQIGMVFQDPMSSLNPVHTVGHQIGETLRIHLGMSRRQAAAQAVELLDQVGIPEPNRRSKEYPHQFSGGMRQRALIAMALACDPALLIADEPTTALDVSVQAQIVELVDRLRRDRNMAVLWITHDLGVVAEIADTVAVMYGGRIVEQAPATTLYRTPRHPYTSGLLGSIPRLDQPIRQRLPEIPGTPLVRERPADGCAFDHRCPMAVEQCTTRRPELEACAASGHRSACLRRNHLEDEPDIWFGQAPLAPSLPESSSGEVLVKVNGLAVHFRGRAGERAVKAVDGVDLVLRRGETLGIVGESGCGKTTLGRAIIGLVEPTRGTIHVANAPVDGRSGAHRRTVQMIFQDPFSSMNPGMTIQDIVSEPIRVHHTHPASEIPDRVAALLGQVGLPPEAARRHPHEFSGGQRQRIAIARALAAEPEAIICDEPVSALDVSVQAQIVNLLGDLQRTAGVSYAVIAHDLAVVRHLSHQVMVMYAGKVVERAPRHDLYTRPLHPYTKMLLEAVPVPDPSRHRNPRPADAETGRTPQGCAFAHRCPDAIPDVCHVSAPSLIEVHDDRSVACHLVTGAVAH